MVTCEILLPLGMDLLFWIKYGYLNKLGRKFYAQNSKKYQLFEIWYLHTFLEVLTVFIDRFFVQRQLIFFSFRKI